MASSTTARNEIEPVQFDGGDGEHEEVAVEGMGLLVFDTDDVAHVLDRTGLEGQVGEGDVPGGEDDAAEQEQDSDQDERPDWEPADVAQRVWGEGPPGWGSSARSSSGMVSAAGFKRHKRNLAISPCPDRG